MQLVYAEVSDGVGPLLIRPHGDERGEEAGLRPAERGGLVQTVELVRQSPVVQSHYVLSLVHAYEAVLGAGSELQAPVVGTEPDVVHAGLTV